MTITSRDPETGQITGKKLSSDKARSMAKKRWQNIEERKADDIQAILQEGGYDPIDPPRVALVLAEQIADRGARSVQAVTQFLRMTRPGTKEGLQRLPAGSFCPTCSMLQPDDNLEDRVVGRDLILALRAQVEADQQPTQTLQTAIDQVKQKDDGAVLKDG